jgi:hypothetical protein
MLESEWEWDQRTQVWEKDILFKFRFLQSSMCYCCLVGEEKLEDTKRVIRGQTTQWSKEKRTKGQITIYKT